MSTLLGSISLVKDSIDYKQPRNINLPLKTLSINHLKWESVFLVT